MLLNLGSFIVMVLIASYFNFYLFQRKGLLTRTAGMIAASVLAVLSSFEFGIIAAQTFDLDLIISVGMAILFAVIVGFPSGIGFGLKSGFNAVLAGSMGAILGTVVGSLFYKSNIVVMLADIVFILLIFVVQKVVDWRLNEKNKKQISSKAVTKKVSYTSTIILLIGVTIVAGYVLLEKNHIQIGAIGKPQSQIATFDEENNLQIATIDVTASGFAPSTTEFKAFTMIKAIFNVKPNAGTGLKLVSKELNLSVDLKTGPNILLLNNPQPGSYEITIESKDYKGNFIVKAEK
ncbi:hypothetical protein Back11_00210 [Paenibacillus baekrokdamisoli]|uniref:EfeO-type cupredoxin-like domain-containing protein n=2 Tax=Paenibacillus baekrokdamisoli TaxID=1712516 RepID=A0A3G9IK68_9BACL|nr:hypothetical protein [Paenibacillus baekrokdamisoli]BBH18676.1 hypothetical protein Back11_00210 [Paenibacillus baekrokdamisoli]